MCSRSSRVYDALLKELAETRRPMFRSDASNDFPPQSLPKADEPRAMSHPVVSVTPMSHAQVLDRYINRLVTLKRIPDALALYRREIDRNPDDPGLYERLAEFVNQNKLAAQTEQIYRRAMQQFPDRSWHHKLARWYLRQKQTAAFEALTKTVVTTFSGTNWTRISSRSLRTPALMLCSTGR